MKKMIFASALFLSFSSFGMDNTEVVKGVCTKAYAHYEMRKTEFQDLCLSSALAALDEGKALDEALSISCESVSEVKYTSAYFCYVEATLALKDIFPYQLVTNGCYINWGKYANSFELGDGYKCYSKNFSYILEHKKSE